MPDTRWHALAVTLGMLCASLAAFATLPAQLRTTTPRTPPPAPAAMPAVASLSFQLRTAPSAAGGHVASVTGGHEVVLRVELSAPAPCVEGCAGSSGGARQGHLPISLSASDASQLGAQRLLIPAGQTAGELVFTPSPVAAPVSMAVQAWSEGTPPREARLTILPPVLIGFELEESSVIGGASVAGTVRFNGKPASATAVRVAMQTTDQQAVVVPPPVTLDVTSETARIHIGTKGVAAPRNAHVVAIHQEKTIAAALTVHPSSLSAFERSTSCCGERLDFRLDGAPPPGGAIVALMNSDTTRAKLPASVRMTAPGMGLQVVVIPGSDEKRVNVTAEYRGTTKNAYVIAPKLVKPDLHFTTSIFFSNGSTITTVPDGQPLRFCAVVEAHRPNALPNVPIPASTLRITLRDGSAAPAVGQRTVDVPLVFDGMLQNPQQPVRHCLDLPGLPPGGRTAVTVQADADDRVDEDREDNNTATATVSRP